MDAWKPDVCIYHDPCPDGFASAWIARSRWPDVETIPANYGRGLPWLEDLNVDGKNVLIADFSFSAAMLLDLAERARSIVILDHHKTAQADLAAFAADWPQESDGLPVPFTALAANHCLFLTTARGNPAIVACFDMNRSGAMLTWKFCHGEEPAPLMIQLIEDRDLWRFSVPGTRMFSLLLRTIPFSFGDWDIFEREFSTDRARMWDQAAAIEQFYDRLLADIVPTATLRSVGKWDGVPVAHAPYAFASDLGHALLKAWPDAPFAAVAVDAYGGRTWSLRSEDGRVDVSEVAKAFGGGGHRNAAGFRTPA